MGTSPTSLLLSNTVKAIRAEMALQFDYKTMADCMGFMGSLQRGITQTGEHDISQKHIAT
jgi:hypothetical protein